jgi:hypothetical protein
VFEVRRLEALLEAFHADVAVADGAFGVVALEGEGAFGEFASEVAGSLDARGFVVLEDALSIDDECDATVLDDDFLSPPFAVLGGGATDVDQSVEAAGFDPVGVGVIDLGLEAVFRPAAGLVAGVEIDAAVGSGFGHDFDFEVEVFEWLQVSLVKQVASGSEGDERTILDLPRIGVLLGFRPSVEGLAVHERNEAFFGVCGRGEGSEGEGEGEYEGGVVFHAGECSVQCFRFQVQARGTLPAGTG